MQNDLMAAIEARAKRFGPMRDANALGKIHGECGDTAEVWLRIDGGRVRKGSFMTDGCGWSKRCCDAAVTLAEGMTVAEAASLSAERVLAAMGPVPQDHLHCALLAAHTVRAAIEDYATPRGKPSLSEWLKGRRG